MEKYSIEDKQTLVALIHLNLDVLANQAAISEMLLKQQAGGDEEQYNLLVAALEQKVDSNWKRLFDLIMQEYAHLPSEVFHMMRESKNNNQ